MKKAFKFAIATGLIAAAGYGIYRFIKAVNEDDEAFDFDYDFCDDFDDSDKLSDASKTEVD